MIKHFKHKDYLPAEVKPEDVVEAEDFEVRYDQIKQLAFLFKEEDLLRAKTRNILSVFWIFGILTRKTLIICVPAHNMLMIFLKIPNLRTVPRF